jgi:glycosyltransferase involved in cell wall biosynthesis
MLAAMPALPKPFPVLFLVPNLETGGAERQLTELVTRMDPTRFRPIVVCQKGGGPFFDEIAQAGIEVHRLEVHGRSDPRFPLRLAAICRRGGVRAMVIRGFSTGVIGRIVGRMLRIRPLIMAEHSTGRIDPDPKKRPIERLLAPLADGVIAVAKGQIPYLVEDKGYDAKKIRVIYNGIDLQEWKPLPRDEDAARELGIAKDAPVAGILAMLRPEKDHATFLRAAKIVSQSVPDARFLIVGEGVEREKLEALAAELGIADRARFTGRRADVKRVLSLFDVSVLTSVTVETFPMSFLEAMAMAKPLVATPAGGVPEMIDEGVNGFLVPMRNADALASALTKLLRDRATARAMGLRSRTIVEQRFTIEDMVHNTEHYIHELASRHAGDDESA